MEKNVGRRQTLVLRLMTKLNDLERQGGSYYFDCGELGVVNIYWKGMWRTSWYDRLEKAEEFLR